MLNFCKDIFDEYLQVMTCKAKKINKLFSYEYDPVILKKINAESMAITSAYDSNSDDSEINESNSDTNKSDSNIYFKFNNFDSNNEYNYKLHEKLQLCMKK
ncbi:hypothetical protein GLOIN_2v1787673 [Rhizophagus irregularis DAOM 181602=DAOM 197198]|nr:hypothetical protein GLOIN_2v1787673 [Rhizophagus irregularis DAOM 181602=DAOM 197198]